MHINFSYFVARYFAETDKLSFVSDDSDLSVWPSVDQLCEVSELRTELMLVCD